MIEKLNFALAALEDPNEVGYLREQALDALRSVIAEMEAGEPVMEIGENESLMCRTLPLGTKLYTHPHPKAEPDRPVEANKTMGGPVQEPVKLWLWKNFVNGVPEYWAFDNAFPVGVEHSDPLTLGEPCGYALLKESRKGRNDIADNEVLRRVVAAEPQAKPPKCVKCGDELMSSFASTCYTCNQKTKGK